MEKSNGAPVPILSAVDLSVHFPIPIFHQTTATLVKYPKIRYSSRQAARLSPIPLPVISVNITNKHYNYSSGSKVTLTVGGSNVCGIKTLPRDVLSRWWVFLTTASHSGSYCSTLDVSVPEVGMEATCRKSLYIQNIIITADPNSSWYIMGKPSW